MAVWQQDYQRLLDDAKKADAAYRQAVKAAQDDRMLSDAGKRAAIDRAEAQYQQTVADLQRQARPLLEKAQERNQAALKQAGGKEFASMRAVLGDSMAGEITRRRLELLSVRQVAQWAQEATGWGDAWAARLLVELADLELTKRAASGDAEADAMRRFELPGTADPEIAALEGEARELANVGGLVSKLDARTDRINTAARLNVNPEYAAEHLYQQS